MPDRSARPGVLAARVLHHVSQFVRQQALPAGRSGRVLACPEVDISSFGECGRLHGPGDGGRLAVTVNTDGSEAGAERSAHRSSQSAGQLLTLATPGGQSGGDVVPDLRAAQRIIRLGRPPQVSR